LGHDHFRTHPNRVMIYRSTLNLVMTTSVHILCTLLLAILSKLSAYRILN